MAFGAMTAKHLTISLESLLVISTKIKKAIFGRVQKVIIRLGRYFLVIIPHLGRFPVMMKIPYLIKSQR